MKTLLKSRTLLDRLQTEEAIETIKTTFAAVLSKKLDLKKISAPAVVWHGTGINDDLNGIENPISFKIKGFDSEKVEIVQSLAKWKRLRITELGIEAGKGILTDMRALRPDEDLSSIHSIYVDQWDWEKHITEGDRSLEYLKMSVEKIYSAICETEHLIAEHFPEIKSILPEKIHFVHTEELQEMYPEYSSKQREDKVAEQYGAVFIIGIGGDLVDGKPHDGRAPDYDDWTTPTSERNRGLNGDIVFWHPMLKRAFEISSMGIRVDRNAMLKQLKISKQQARKKLYFHQLLLNGKLSPSLGGGIGQSRLCMFLLRKSHIGEVQVGIWTPKIRKQYQEMGVELM
jgi:aspartate--ammonia ligase